MLKGLSRLGTGKLYTLIMAVLISSMAMLPITASAAYYNTYSTIASIPDANGANSTQGFDVGSVYAYSVKINADDTKAIIYKTKISDGTTTLMTNGDTGTTYATYLGHAGSLSLSTIDGVTYMFITTSDGGNMNLVKLKYVGATYYKVGNYSIKYNGVDKTMTGVKITSKDANNINFLFKNGRTYYTGSLPLTANSGTIDVAYGFYLNIGDALVNGSTVSDITDYVMNAFGYYNDTIYVPMTKENVSIVLVYRNISTASGTIYADDDLSFRITSNEYPALFEIEGLDVGPDGKLYFDTNRRVATGDADHDGIHYFKNYIAP